MQNTLTAGKQEMAAIAKANSPLFLSPMDYSKAQCFHGRHLEKTSICIEQQLLNGLLSLACWVHRKAVAKMVKHHAVQVFKTYLLLHSLFPHPYYLRSAAPKENISGSYSLRNSDEDVSLHLVQTHSMWTDACIRGMLPLFLFANNPPYTVKSIFLFVYLSSRLSFAIISTIFCIFFLLLSWILPISPHACQYFLSLKIDPCSHILLQLLLISQISFMAKLF